jgi:hypothetical protein
MIISVYPLIQRGDAHTDISVQNKIFEYTVKQEHVSRVKSVDYLDSFT